MPRKTGENRTRKKTSKKTKGERVYSSKHVRAQTNRSAKTTKTKKKK